MEKMSKMQFLRSRSDQELNEYGFYSEIRENLADKFSLDLNVLYALESKKMAREQLIKLYTKKNIEQACKFLKYDRLFQRKISRLYSGTDIYKRFLFLTEPLVRDFPERYLLRRDHIANIIGQNKTYVFEKTSSFIEFISGEYEISAIRKLQKYSERIAYLFEHCKPREERMALLDIMLKKEIYLLEIREDILTDLFFFSGIEKKRIADRVYALIGKK